MSELIPYEEKDYLNEANSRVTYAFENSEVFLKYLQILIAGNDDIQKAIKEVKQLRSLDTATGKQLDNIGELVGQPRELLEADLYEYFGFEGKDTAQTFGEYGDPTVGGFFYSFGTPLGGNILLDDETYRMFIRAKIFKNSTASTPEEFIDVINFIFKTPQCCISNEGGGSVTVLFGRELSPFEKALLNYVSYSQAYPSRLIPKPAGVKMNFGEFRAGQAFGFQGVPGAKGFADAVGLYGYGLGYGLNYGESDFGLGERVYETTFDGSRDFDGSWTYTSDYTYAGAEEAGYFATLY